MYTSAQGAANIAATPLQNPDPSTIDDVSDLTPPLNAGGQPDTRFSLGLNVTRYYEVVRTSFRDHFVRNQAVA